MVLEGYKTYIFSLVQIGIGIYLITIGEKETGLWFLTTGAGMASLRNAIK